MSRTVAGDAVLRMQKRVKQELPAERVPEFQDSLSQAVEKAVAKCFYGLKHTLPPSLWEGCVRALGQAVQTGESPERKLP